MPRKGTGAPKPARSHAWGGGGPSPYVPLYLALAAQGAIPIYLVYSAPPRPQETWLYVLLAAQAVTALGVFVLRLLIQDWHATSPLPERVFYYMIPASIFFVPAFLRGHHVFPEGFILGMFPLLLVAVEPPQARRYLGWTLLAFWSVLYRRPDAGVEWVLAFGATTLWSLACIHYAFVGAPFGLSGWWPARRAFLSAAIYALPASLAGFMVWAAWPEPKTTLGAAFPPPEAFADRLSGMGKEEFYSFLVQLGLMAVLVSAALIFLYYLRRWLNRRMRPAALPHVVGGDLSEIDYAARKRPPRRPALSGNRARIVKLWARWARRMEVSVGAVRAPGETAAELDARLAPVTGGESPERREIIAIFDRAHYGESEPGAEDVKRMRELAEADPDRMERRDA